MRPETGEVLPRFESARGWPDKAPRRNQDSRGMNDRVPAVLEHPPTDLPWRRAAAGARTTRVLRSRERHRDTLPPLAQPSSTPAVARSTTCGVLTGANRWPCCRVVARVKAARAVVMLSLCLRTTQMFASIRAAWQG